MKSLNGIRLVTVLLFACMGEAAHAQSTPSKLELGVQFSALRFQQITIPDASHAFFFTRTFDQT